MTNRTMPARRPLARLPAGLTRVTAAPVSAATTAPRQGTGVIYLGFVALLVIEYGFIAGWVPVLKTARLTTLLAWTVMALILFKTGFQAVTETKQGRLIFYLTVFTGLTIFWAVIHSYVPPNFRYMVDNLGLFLMGAYLVDRPGRIRFLSLSMCAVILLLIARNLDALAQATRGPGFFANYFMGDGNDFAWGLITLLPFPAFLLLGKNRIHERLFGLAALFATMLGILSTQSRGATLGIGGALAFHLLFVSRRKMLGLVAISMVVAFVFVFAPSGYFDRMQTIEDYSNDSSAQGRIRAWKASMRMAVDYPLGVGAGSFNSAFGRYYMPDDPQGYRAFRWISAHSIYFKVLGEYGILGLILLIALIVKNISDNVVSVRLARALGVSSGIQDFWPALLNFGVIGYAIAGAFLSGFGYPHLFLLSGLTAGCRRMLEASVPAGESPTVPAPPAVPVAVWQTGTALRLARQSKYSPPLPRRP